MEATNIAHLVGRMESILGMIEFYAELMEVEDCRKEFLIKKINEAKAANDEIFEMYKKSELDKVKKTFNDEDK